MLMKNIHVSLTWYFDKNMFEMIPSNMSDNYQQRHITKNQACISFYVYPSYTWWKHTSYTRWKWMEVALPKGKNLQEPFSTYKNKGLNHLTTASGFLMFSHSSQIVLCFKLVDGYGNTQVCTCTHMYTYQGAYMCTWAENRCQIKRKRSSRTDKIM